MSMEKLLKILPDRDPDPNVLKNRVRIQTKKRPDQQHCWRVKVRSPKIKTKLKLLRIFVYYSTKR
jgi:hypothetical protein